MRHRLCSKEPILVREHQNPEGFSGYLSTFNSAGIGVKAFRYYCFFFLSLSLFFPQLWLCAETNIKHSERQPCEYMKQIYISFAPVAMSNYVSPLTKL